MRLIVGAQPRRTQGVADIAAVEVAILDSDIKEIGQRLAAARDELPRETAILDLQVRSAEVNNLNDLGISDASSGEKGDLALIADVDHCIDHRRVRAGAPIPIERRRRRVILAVSGTTVGQFRLRAEHSKVVAKDHVAIDAGLVIDSEQIDIIGLDDIVLHAQRANFQTEISGMVAGRGWRSNEGGRADRTKQYRFHNFPHV